MEKVIVCKNIAKNYENTSALNDLTFSIEENKIYGILGRNGAGKSTLLQIISNQIFPSSGVVEINGENPYENEKILSKICFVRDQGLYPKFFKVGDILSTSSSFYPYWDDDFASYLIKEFSLEINKKYQDLSRGMESLVGVVIGLASRAPITILDEPYLGLDAASRQVFYDILNDDFGKNPRTILFSTHLIDEASNLFEHVLILDQGSLILNENINTIMEKSIFVSGTIPVVDQFCANKNIIFEESLGIKKTVAIYCKVSDQDKRDMVKNGLELSPVSLQQLFIYITAKGGSI